MLTAQADFQDTRSVAYRMRSRRMRHFLELLDATPKPVKLLDVGGSIKFWKILGLAGRDDIEFTILNIVPADDNDDRFRYLQGDARDLSRFDDGQFDIVFSNSVIEHVGGWEDQQRMAREVRRVGRRYFVQTPNRYFLLEPHFLVPGFQFFPVSLRSWMVSSFDVGWYKRIPDKAAARREVESISLLSKEQLRTLFPDASIYNERFLGLSKSFVAFGGWRQKK